MLLVLKILGVILGAILGLALSYVLFLLLCWLFVDPRKEYIRHSRFYRGLLNLTTVIVLWLLRIRVHTTGIEAIPKDTKRILFVGNHRSNFDPIVTWWILRQWDVAFISKPENFRIPVFGRFIRKCCFLPIDRENPRNAIKTIQKAAALLAGGQVSIGVYPEGTRSKEGILLPFHNGVFKIAQKADAPIAILRLTGTENIHKNIPFHSTDVYLEVRGILPAETVRTAKTEKIGQKVHDLLLS